MVRRCWVNFQCRGVLLTWITVGQGPIVLAVGVGGGCLDIFFSHLSLLFSFSLSLEDGSILTEILSQRAVKPKTTNQIWHSYSNLDVPLFLFTVFRHRHCII